MGGKMRRVGYNGTHRARRKVRKPKGCPYSRKWQLVEWIMKRYGWSESKAEGTPKAILYAIWYNQR